MQPLHSPRQPHNDEGRGSRDREGAVRKPSKCFGAAENGGVRVEKGGYSHTVTEQSRKKRSLEAESRHVDHTWIDFLSCVKCQIDCFSQNQRQNYSSLLNASINNENDSQKQRCATISLFLLLKNEIHRRLSAQGQRRTQVNHHMDVNCRSRDEPERPVVVKCYTKPIGVCNGLQMDNR